MNTKDKQPKIVSYWNCKGGTGKTSLCYLSGISLSAIGKKVLMIDLDPQCSLTSAIGIKTKKTIYDFLFDSVNIENCISQGDNFDFISGSIKTLKISTVLQNKLSRALSNLPYDYILLDNSPFYNQLIISSIFASDKVVIPSLVSMFDLESASFSINESKEIKESITTILVLNRVNKKSTKEELDYLTNFNLNNNPIRVINSTSVKRIIDRKEEITDKRHAKFRDSIQELIKGVFNHG